MHLIDLLLYHTADVDRATLDYCISLAQGRNGSVGAVSPREPYAWSAAGFHLPPSGYY
jgi:hypothetical protein